MRLWQIEPFNTPLRYNAAVVGLLGTGSDITCMKRRGRLAPIIRPAFFSIAISSSVSPRREAGGVAISTTNSPPGTLSYPKNAFSYRHGIKCRRNSKERDESEAPSIQSLVSTQNRKNDVQPLLARAWPWRSGGFDWPGGLSSTFACLLNLLLMLLQKHAGWNKQAKDSRFENHPGLLSCYVST